MQVNKEEDGDIQHIMLLEWNDINKTRSLINFFALSLSNTITLYKAVMTEQGIP